MSGEIWKTSKRSRIQTVGRVCRALEEEYGRPCLENPTDPIDDLVFIIVSNRTGPNVAAATYHRLKTEFPDWFDVLAGISVLRGLLQPAGLSEVKSRQIVGLLSKIKVDFGEMNLSDLKRKSLPEIEGYLTSLPGVSKKVAKCVMMYTMGCRVLPVDIHVYRIAKRLGWTARKRADQCHEELEALVPPGFRYAFHVDCIAHGRTVCKSARPVCFACPIRRYCLHHRVSHE